MDLFDFDNVKAEKANAIMRYRRLRKIANLFRFFELCLALILLSWFSTRLPIAVQISGKYLRDLCVVLVSPRFVFLVGNVIILILFAKSGQFSGQNPSANNAGTNLYDEFVKHSETRQKIRTESPPAMPEEIVYQDKQTVLEESSVTRTYGDTLQDTATDKKTYRRSQSENLNREVYEKPLRELRRSDTEKCRKFSIPGEDQAEASYSKEEMSNEEFQRTIEAFIAKQVRFHREESMAIVLQNQS